MDIWDSYEPPKSRLNAVIVISLILVITVAALVVAIGGAA